MNQPPIRSLMLKKNQDSYQKSDEDIILQYKATLDNYYVGVLFERYANIIFGISLKYMKNKHDAEDIMVEIYEKLELTLKTKEVGTFRNWLYVMVKNYCVSKLRSLQTEAKRIRLYKDYVGQLNIDSNEFDVEVDIAKPTNKISVTELVKLLPEKQKACITYFYFENKSYKEIAALYGETVGKIRSYIQNGRRNLKLKLTQEK